MLELNRKIMRGLIALFGLSILLSLSACFQGFKPQKQDNHVNYDNLLSQNSVLCEGISIAFDKTADWDADDTKGFIAQIQLSNVGSQAVGWQLEFDFDAQITNMWNASYTLSNGNHYTVNPASWNTRIDPNQTINFGFQGTYTTEQLAEPQNVSCNGQEQEEPYDLYEGFNLPDKLPTVSDEAAALALRRYNEALAELDLRGRRLVEEGRLVFNGSSFVHLGTADALSNGELSTQQNTSQPPSPFKCFLNEGFTGDPIDPSELQTTGEEIAQRYKEAYEALSPENKRLVDIGRLFFNGFSFVPRPHNYDPLPPPQEQTPQTGEEGK